MAKLFEGVKVIDFTQNMAGPLCAGMLSDFGAEVIKVERPVTGEDIRTYWPKLGKYGYSFYAYNRGKRCIEADLRDPEGIEIIKKIIADMDILIEAFRPGVMKRFGLDYESVIKINPNIIYCSVSVFGQTGPYAQKPGYDLIAQAMSGMMDMTGEEDGPPMKSGFVIGDMVGALDAYGAICSALYYKLKTGTGQYIDISLADGLVAAHNFMEFSQVMGKPVTRSGNHTKSGLCPYGLFRGKGKQNMIVAAPNNKLWGVVCKVIGKEEYIDHPDFKDAQGRLNNLDQVIDLIEGWAKTFDDISDAVKLLEDADVPCCKVLQAHEIKDDEQFKSRGLFYDLVVPSAVEGEPPFKIITKGPWIKMSKTPAEVKRCEDVGESNKEIYSRYGLSDEKIKELESKWRNKVLGASKKK